MTQPRLIPCILLKNGLIVRSQSFETHQIIGNPISTIARLSNWSVDELILLDISGEDFHDMRREDHSVRYQGSTTLHLIKQIGEVAFMPLSVGGRIRNLEDIHQRLAIGADKCVINTRAVESPGFISDAAEKFGSQCIVVSIDARRHPDDRLEVFTKGGSVPTGMTPADWASRVESLGAGEIFLNSIDRDGAGTGFDLDLIRRVTEVVSIPVIACGGIGKYGDLPAGITKGGASAVAAANIFHFFELSYPLAKKACLDTGLDMRPVKLDSPWFPREPVYDRAHEDALIEDRMQRAKSNTAPARVLKQKPKTRWCTKCLYSSAAATPMSFDEEGVCMGCRTGEAKNAISESEWSRRKDLLRKLLEERRCRDGSRYDCVIAVSGGKDSYFQTHFIKFELGLNPLLVTYYGNNYLDVGNRNLFRMKEVFGVDHVIFSPGTEVLKKLNRLGFIIMGDMNWHNHTGIGTVPLRIAIQHKIPIVIWGEHGWMDLSGQYSMNDFVEWSYRYRLEHFARGFEWTYMAGREGLTAQDMIPWQYPSDTEIFEVGLRGVHLGNYVHWDANNHTEMMIEKYGFEIAEEPFERTYRRASNLDDMHENGVHDYLKYIKFGYGRGTDHVSKDIRSGIMGRGQGVDLVRKHDHIKPNDLARWLEYVGMDEDEFDRICDTFRDPRVWHKKAGEWIKQNPWD